MPLALRAWHAESSLIHDFIIDVFHDLTDVVVILPEFGCVLDHLVLLRAKIVEIALISGIGGFIELVSVRLHRLIVRDLGFSTSDGRRRHRGLVARGASRTLRPRLTRWIMNGAAHRADDRLSPQVIKSRPATETGALQSPLRLCQGHPPLFDARGEQLPV